MPWGWGSSHVSGDSSDRYKKKPRRKTPGKPVVIPTKGTVKIRIPKSKGA
jgi:hypothetical protein